VFSEVSRQPDKIPEVIEKFMAEAAKQQAKSK